MRTLLTVLALVAVTLAGCSDKPAPQDDDPTFEDIDLDAGKDTGVIRGVVVDHAIQAIAGATIKIVGQPQETTSNENGAFGFSNLPPGTYFLQATRVGFEATQVSVEVAAGVAKPPIIKILMAANPDSIPFALPAQYTAYVACESQVANRLVTCDGGSGAFGVPDNEVFLLTSDRVPDAIQIELDWDHVQTFGQRLTSTIGACGGEYCSPFGDANFLCQNWGPAPLWCRVNTTDGQASGHFCCHQNIPSSGLGTHKDSGVALHIGADCTVCADPVAPAVGLGLVTQQRVEVYLWSFYNMAPEEGWLFVKDGEPNVPED